jgi:hypothetical protein
MGKKVKIGDKKAKARGPIIKAVTVSFILCTFIFFGLLSEPKIVESGDDFLQANDFQIIADDIGVINYFTPGQLAAAKDKLVKVINDLPDIRVRNDLIDLIKSGELKLRFFSITNGEFAFLGPFFVLGINPSVLMEKNLSYGYYQSFLVHEYRHIEDWQGKYMDSYLYRPCEIEKYTSHQCKLEWWDAEWRAVKEQAIFLQKNHLTNAIPTGPAVNNQEIFKKNTPDRAALEYLLKNYYSRDDIDSGFREVFPEFYKKKLASISF